VLGTRFVLFILIIFIYSKLTVLTDFVVNTCMYFLQYKIISNYFPFMYSISAPSTVQKLTKQIVFLQNSSKEGLTMYLQI